MPQGTLANLANSAFVRTPPAFAARIVRSLLSFPAGKATNVLDPTAGEGDLLVPCQDIPYARLYGVEISAERTAVARTRLPQAELVSCAFEGVSIPKGSMSLVLANPPYFFQDGKRAEYRIIADAGVLLMPGGMMVAIIPARSAWDGTMIHHWCRWYDRVRVLKFPDRTQAEDESAFEDYTQICVVGIRRAEPRDPLPAESRRLQGYRYHTPSVSAPGRSPSRVQAGWGQGTPPPGLPEQPISDSYPVPESIARPQIVVRNADESMLLTALKKGQQEEEEAESDNVEPVTSRTWFTLKPRWCRCRTDARNQPGPRNPAGRTRVRTPLWTDARFEAARRKHPQLPFAAWSAAVERLYGHKGHTVVAETTLTSARAVSKASVAGGKRKAVSLGLPLTTGKGLGRQRDDDTSYVAREPLPESFSPYDYLYRFYDGCVALAVIDESHNGRGRDTDIAHAHHQAMLASQTRMLTSGTHFGGDILGFYHYWYRYHPQFWRSLGLGWNDADKALSRYGVIQEWTKEYESDARRGSGQTTVQVSTIPAPGLSAKLIPYLLEDMVYLTVLDVGAHMPPRIEIPEIVSMRDAEIVEALDEAERARREATRKLTAFKQANLHSQNGHSTDAQKELECLQQAVEEVSEHERVVQVWAEPRHLAAHYGRLVRALDDLARKQNTAARLAKGTVPRWFAVLPCDRPFEVWETRRDHWGDTLGRTLLVETERLSWEHMYPLELRLIALVQRELGEGRRVMLYIDQNDLRSTPRRLEWVLKDVQPWTLPNSVAAEDRQQAILQAVQQGHNVVIVPYRRVNEGLNLQSAIDTIVWVEMALNLFMLDQASRRAWRLGKCEEVRIYYLAYANTAGHTKLRKLGQQSGAAAAFAGEPARGALIEQSEEEEGVDEENIALQLYGEEEVAEEEAVLKAVFAKSAEELRKALVRGREWLGGLKDDLAERLAALASCPTARVSVWAEHPLSLALSISRTTRQTEQVGVEQPERKDERQHEPVITLPAATSPVLTALSPLLPDEATTITPPTVPLLESTLTPALAVGSRAEVVFGRSEHIALARVRSRARRPGGYGEKPRRRIPVSERDIPSLVEDEVAGADEQCHQMLIPSLWDQLVAPTSQTSTATPTLFAVSSHDQHTPLQSQLWEREMAHPRR